VHTIDPADYVGLDADEATTKLHALGYDDVKRTTRQGSPDGKTGTVASMAPTGQVSVDEPVTLTVWGVPEKSAPTGGDEKKGPGGGGHGNEGHGKGKNK
jgi:beta-lactam-binding protein with PASTA domain